MRDPRQAASFRVAEISEADALADLWHSGWQDTHTAILPAELARHRTLDSFRQRTRAHLADVRVAGEVGKPLGFSMLKQDELYQFYVAPQARGTGLAPKLLEDAERALLARGVVNAWLACAIGNGRAARFYAKNGWRLAHTVSIDVEIPGGTYPLQVWRYEKRLVD
jgi:GNAT superfamily N-acetyltransferase